MMIEDGRVRLNRKTVTELGTKADPLKDLIEVDKKPITGSGPRAYMLLYKPKNCISSASDPKGRPVVTELIKKHKKARLYPVGRLDYDAEGAILLTNDGELTNRLIHPNFKISKTYLVKVSDVPGEKQIERISKGILLEDGRTLPAKARLIRVTKENSWLEVTVIEGRNRLIKRLCQAIGHPVLKLRRTSFAGLTLKGLKVGESRPLTEIEVERLYRITEQTPQKKGGGRRK